MSPEAEMVVSDVVTALINYQRDYKRSCAALVAHIESLETRNKQLELGYEELRKVCKRQQKRLDDLQPSDPIDIQ